MSKSVICEGNTSSEAIEKGLKELGCKLEDVNVKILENEDKKIFFSILDPRVVRVELTMKSDEKSVSNDKEEVVASKEEIESSKNNIKAFLKEFCSEFGDISFKITDDGKDIIYVSIDGNDSHKLIGYRGDALNALQTIITSIGNKNIKDRIKVYLNVNNYKEKREQSLKELADKLEKSVCKTKKKVVLEPMNSYDRKIIHTQLQNSKYVKTYSIGEEPHRHVVIELKNDKED